MLRRLKKKREYPHNFFKMIVYTLTNPISFSLSYQFLKIRGLIFYITISFFVGLFDLFFNENYAPKSLYLEFRNYPKLGSIIEEFIIGVYAILLMSLFIELMLYFKIKKEFSFSTTLFTVIYYFGIAYSLTFLIMIGVSLLNPQLIFLVNLIKGASLFMLLFVPYLYCILTYSYEMGKWAIIVSYLIYLNLLFFIGVFLP